MTLARAYLNTVSRETVLRRRMAKPVSVLMISLVVAGCAPNDIGAKEQLGTGAGALLGGVAGAFLGKGSGKAVAILAGAALGGIVGNRIGAMLDENDRKALEAQTRQAIVSQPDNVQTNWSSPSTGATAIIAPANSRVETRPVRIVRDANVAPAPQLDLIGAKYVAKSTTNVRLAPSTDADIATSIPGGSALWAVGKVHDRPWIMVARNGKSIGYVTAANVVPAPVAQTAALSPSAPIKPATAPAQAVAAPDGAFDLDTAAPVRTPADLDALGPTEKADVVTASVTCRDIKTTVTANGQTATDAQTACKSPDGAWQLD